MEAMEGRTPSNIGYKQLRPTTKVPIITTTHATMDAIVGQNQSPSEKGIILLEGDVIEQSLQPEIIGIDGSSSSKKWTIDQEPWMTTKIPIPFVARELTFLDLKPSVNSNVERELLDDFQKIY